jgi:uncharacterized protein YndB with AHSA1/START domain
MNGKLLSLDGRPAVRLERRLDHPPEKVWRALTEADQLSQWYPFRAIEMDLRVGGKIRFDDGEGMTMDAVITEFDPPRCFAFSEHAPAEMVRESDDLVRFELHPQDNGCLLIFTHLFDDRPAAASYVTGWTGCLDALETVLAGRTVEWTPAPVELYEAYVAAFGLNAGTAEGTADGWRVRFDRQLRRVSVDEVWALLHHSGGTPVLGGSVPPAFTIANLPTGVITAVEPPTLLEYTWEVAGRPGGRVRWELSDGPGGARITLIQSGPNELAELQAVALAAWQNHIEALVRRLLDQKRAKPASPLGTLTRTEAGRYALRFERHFAHAPEKLWRVITEAEHLRDWFPAVVDFDLTPGAQLRFCTTLEQQHRFGLAADYVTYGQVTRVDPPHLLEYTWEAESLRWELTPDGNGGCHLVFTHLFDDPKLAPAVSAGWHAGLEVVEAQVTDRPVDWSIWERADQLGEAYASHFS